VAFFGKAYGDILCCGPAAVGKVALTGIPTSAFAPASPLDRFLGGARSFLGFGLPSADAVEAPVALDLRRLFAFGSWTIMPASR
jgi:hypothetical protein